MALFTLLGFGILFTEFGLSISPPNVVVDPMCTNDYRGGLGCNFERGICGGIVTEHGQAQWTWADTESGPIRTHVDAQNTTISQGHYIYLDAANTNTKTASMELFLSPVETSICLSLYYATTGTGSLVLRVAAQYETGSTLLDEKMVQTGGEWDRLFLPVCLVGGKRNFLLIETEGFTAEQTIAFDYVEITKSLRTCNGETFSLQCSCANSKESHQEKPPPPENAARPVSPRKLAEPERDTVDLSSLIPAYPLVQNHPRKQETGGYYSCSFTYGLCEGMSLTQSHLDGAIWVLSDASVERLDLGDSKITAGHYIRLEAHGMALDHGPASLILDLPHGLSAAVTVRIGYIMAMRRKSEDVRLQLFSRQPHHKMLLAEAWAVPAGPHTGELWLDCCVETESHGTQIIIEGDYGKASSSSAIIALYYVNIEKGSAICPSDILPTASPTERTEFLTPTPDSEGETWYSTSSFDPPVRTTPEETEVLKAAVQYEDNDSFLGDLSAIIASCVSAIVIIIFGVIGVVVWRRRSSRSRSETEASVLPKGEAEEESIGTEEKFVGTRISNPLYGIHRAVKTPDVISPSALVMTNNAYRGESKA